MRLALQILILSLTVFLLCAQDHHLTQASVFTKEQITERLKSANSTTFLVTDSKFSKYEQSTFHLDYGYIINGYALELYDITDPKSPKLRSYTGIEKSIQAEDYGDGCTAIQRDINFTPYARGKIPSDNSNIPEDQRYGVGDYTFQHFVVNTEKGVILIFDSQFRIFQTTFSVSSLYSNRPIDNIIAHSAHAKYDNKLELGTIDKKDANVEIQIVQKDNTVFVFTAYGAVTFSVDFVENIVAKKVVGYSHRQKIYRAIVAGNHLFLASGKDGLDQYLINNDGTLTLTSIQDFDYEAGQKFDIRDIKFDQQRNKMFILDYEMGLHVYSTSPSGDILHNDEHFLLPIKNGERFDFHRNIFVIIQKHFDDIQSLDIGTEYYIDLVNKKWYENQIFYEDLTIYDVIIEENYGVLLSDVAHRVITHSIYPDFRQDWSKKYDYFNDAYIKEFKIIKFRPDAVATKQGVDLHEEHLLFGLGRENISIHKLARQSPRITCHSKKSQTRQFKLNVNATLCPNANYGENFDRKQTIAQSDIFHQCLISHKFEVQFKRRIDEDDAKKAGLVVALILLLLLCIIIGIVLWYTCYYKPRVKQQTEQMNKQVEEKNRIQREYEKLNSYKQQKKEHANDNFNVDNKMLQSEASTQNQQQYQPQKDDDLDIELESELPQNNNNNHDPNDPRYQSPGYESKNTGEHFNVERTGPQLSSGNGGHKIDDNDDEIESNIMQFDDEN